MMGLVGEFKRPYGGRMETKMANYLCKTTFGSFRFSGDFSQAASNLWSLPDRGDDSLDGFPTPFQVADARHIPERAARLLLEYFGRDYWCDHDCVDDGYAVTVDGQTRTFERDEEDEAREYATQHGAQVEEIETFDGLSKDDYLASLIVSVEAEADEQD